MAAFLLSASALSGCDGVMQQATALASKPITVVLSPGHRFDIAGVSTPVFGSDPCPPGDATMAVLFGPSPHEGLKSCIVMDEAGDQRHKLVRFMNQHGALVLEPWEVVHDKVNRHGIEFPTVQLRRPDGSWAISSDSTTI
jgi:hypothetical protein